MRIGILSAGEEEHSPHENELLISEIEKRGHAAVIIPFADGRHGVDQNNLQYGVIENGQLNPITDLDVVIPRINEPDPLFVKFGIAALNALIDSGIPATSTPEAIRIAKDKDEAQRILEKNKIRTPKTLYLSVIEAASSEEVLKAVEPDPSERVVIKNINGTTGKGTKPMGDRSNALPVLDDNRDPVLIQEFVKGPKYPEKFSDVRIIVIGGIAVYSYMRVSSEPRTNLYGKDSQSEAVDYEATPDEKKIAIDAAEIIGLEIAGVDLFQTPGGPLVNELNASTGFGSRPIDEATIVSGIVDYAIEKALLTK
jgi:ribosomal protein S6--L-glutamate ligase